MPDDLNDLDQRSAEVILIARHIAEKGVTKLRTRRNKAFSSYLSSSRKAASLARGASMRKTGRGARATFDLLIAAQHDQAGE